MNDMRMPEQVYAKQGPVVRFNQLGVKIVMDAVSNEDYFRWLDHASEEIATLVPGTQIAEKENARIGPPLNTAVYYDTPELEILPTGALLRTSCNKVTHAFCAFKMTRDIHGVRNDHRYVFDGYEKTTIQQAPASAEAVAIVKRLLARRDVEQPGGFLEQSLGIPRDRVQPTVLLEDYRYTFFVWIDSQDALRCSLDRYEVSDLRLPEGSREKQPISEVEISIYPRIDPGVADDPRVVASIEALARSLTAAFDVWATTDIKYQRAARALGFG